MEEKVKKMRKDRQGVRVPLRLSALIVFPSKLETNGFLS